MSSQEPENYSIDDMMDRLKHRKSENGSPDGELVIRDDGSQVVRVRKRRRRSRQPQKEAREKAEKLQKMRILALSASVFIALLAAFAWLLYVNSSIFRSQFVSKVEQSTGAKVELKEFRVTPIGANGGYISLVWPGGSYFKNLEIRHFRSDIRFPSYFNGKIRGSYLDATTGSLRLGVPLDGTAAQGPSLGFENDPVVFDRVNVDKLFVQAGEDDGMQIRDTNASLIRYAPNLKTQLQLSGGTLRVFGWQQFEIERAHIESGRSLIEISKMYLIPRDVESGKPVANARLLVTGAIDAGASAKASTCSLELTAVPLSSVTSKHVAELFSGVVDTGKGAALENYLKLNPSAARQTEARIAFQNSTVSEGFMVKGFPFLTGISRSFGMEMLKKPVFNETAEGILSLDNHSAKFENLNMEKRGMLCIRGDLEVGFDGKLNGKLKIGIDEKMIDVRPGEVSARAEVFHTIAGGYAWAEVNVSGHALRPQDDFDAQMKAAAEGATSPGGARRDNVPGFDDLTTPR